MEAHICQPVYMPVTVLHNIVVLCSWAVSGLDSVTYSSPVEQSVVYDCIPYNVCRGLTQSMYEVFQYET